MPDPPHLRRLGGALQTAGGWRPVAYSDGTLILWVGDLRTSREQAIRALLAWWEYADDFGLPGENEDEESPL